MKTYESKNWLTLTAAWVFAPVWLLLSALLLGVILLGLWLGEVFTGRPSDMSEHDEWNYDHPGRDYSNYYQHSYDYDNPYQGQCKDGCTEHPVNAQEIRLVAETRTV